MTGRTGLSRYCVSACTPPCGTPHFLGRRLRGFFITPCATGAEASSCCSASAQHGKAALPMHHYARRQHAENAAVAVAEARAAAVMPPTPFPRSRSTFQPTSHAACFFRELLARISAGSFYLHRLGHYRVMARGISWPALRSLFRLLRMPTRCIIDCLALLFNV